MLDGGQLGKAWDTIGIKRLRDMVKRGISDYSQRRGLTAWFQDVIDSRTAVSPTEDLSDLLPSENSTKPGLYITRNLFIEAIQELKFQKFVTQTYGILPRM